MLALGWGLAAAIGAVAGMMVAPIVFLEPNMMIGMLLYGFAGALLGGIDSPAGAVIGGFLVGVLENLVGTYVPFVGTDLKLTVALALIMLVLLLRPNGLFGRRVVEAGLRRTDGRARRSRAVRSALAMPAGRRRCCLPLSWSATTATFQLTLALVYAIAMLGLNILTGYNGQFSLGHGAFYAIGAYTAAIMMDQCGLAVLGDPAGRGRWSASARVSCSASRRCASRASTWRSRPSRSPSPRRRSSNTRPSSHSPAACRAS